jgi:hypothetical protein
VYIRLTITVPHPDSLQPQGLFAATYALLDARECSADEVEAIDQLLDWFYEHLPIPRSRRISHKAIFWFKSDQRELVRHAWALARLLEKHGRLVQLHKTHHPGYVRFEDRYQVAAERVAQPARRVRRTAGPNSAKAWRRFIRRSKAAHQAAIAWRRA